MNRLFYIDDFRTINYSNIKKDMYSINSFGDIKK